jgi:hypothetical protein
MRSSTSRIGHGSTIAAGLAAKGGVAAPARAAFSRIFFRFSNDFTAFTGQLQVTWSRPDDVLHPIASLRS